MNQEMGSAFIEHLQRLHEHDRGALATLRHSLAFAPGDYPKAYPYVERFVGRDWHVADSRRLALYAVAGLFALYPVTGAQSLAYLLGLFMKEKDRPSLELRFTALLEADADGVMNHLRQAISLLVTEVRGTDAGKAKGIDYKRLLEDLSVVLNERAAPGSRDRLKRQWARDFYVALLADSAEETVPVLTNNE